MLLMLMLTLRMLTGAAAFVLLPLASALRSAAGRWRTTDAERVRGPQEYGRLMNGWYSRLMNGWYSPSAAASHGTVTYRNPTTGREVEITEISSEPTPYDSPADLVFVGEIDRDQWVRGGIRKGVISSPCPKIKMTKLTKLNVFAGLVAAAVMAVAFVFATIKLVDECRNLPTTSIVSDQPDASRSPLVGPPCIWTGRAGELDVGMVVEALDFTGTRWVTSLVTRINRSSDIVIVMVEFGVQGIGARTLDELRPESLNPKTDSSCSLRVVH